MQLFRTKSVEQTIAETGEEGRKLKRNLTWWDLSIMGVAVAVGAGIFSVGAQAAAFHAGPAVIISFLIAGIVCGAAVMCYAEFASMIPVAGSAYTFTYTTVGEIMAWIIGWDLILEMLMAGSVISKYWGVYLNDFMRLMGWNANTNLTFGSFQGRHRVLCGDRRLLLRQGLQLHPVHSAEPAGLHRGRLLRRHRRDDPAVVAVRHRHDPIRVRRSWHPLGRGARVLRVHRIRRGGHRL